MSVAGQLESTPKLTTPRLVWFSGLKIGTRLAASFIIIAVLLLAANIVAFSELHAVRIQAERLTLADDKLIAVLRVHTSILAFRETLDSLARERNAQAFNKQATDLQVTLLSEVQSAQYALNRELPGFERDPTLLPTLEAVKSAIPSQVNILTKLASAGDWEAVRLRSDTQVRALSSLTTSTIEKVDSEVAAEQTRALESIQRGERHVLATLTGTAMVTLLISGVLGFWVTRSITRPLSQLGEGAQALAHGDFTHRVQVAGTDELAELSYAFNNAGQELRKLYEDLRQSEAEFRIVFDSAAIGMTLVGANGSLIRANQAFVKLLGYSREELERLNFADITHPDDMALSSSFFQELVDGKRDGYRIKKRYIRKDGEIRWTWLTTSAMRYAQGQLQYCVSMIEDVTKQEAASEALRQLTTRMLRVQEEEQRRIAREVHDSTSQEMTALALHLGAAKKTENLSPKALRLITKCLTLAQHVSRELRTFSYLLHPPMLDEFGLWSALRVFVTEFRNRSGIRANIEMDSRLEGQRLDPSQEIALFRFVQEAFTNVYRHSGSKTASVKIKEEGETIQVAIADQGRGIPQRVMQEINPFSGRLGSVGIPGMRERIQQIGGSLDIQSGNRGTVICASIPKSLSKNV
jgi:PAS domain S-box-containing protein